MATSLAALALSQANDGECARLVEGESNGWLDMGTQVNKFSIKIAVRHWKAGDRVVLTWEEGVSIEEQYDAHVVSTAGVLQH